VQGATSHCLGQTFSCKEMFNITFSTDDGETKHPIQNSWGFTTRSIGVAIMIHSDNKGLVLPPRAAATQVAIVPIHFKNKTEIVDEKAAWLYGKLKASGVRVMLDDRPYNPGWKFNDHELHGVPLKVELGPRDVQNNTLILSRRDKPNKEDKISIPMDENVCDKIKELLEQMQEDLFQAAKDKYAKQTIDVTKWEDFVPALNNKCMVLAPWCEEVSCEDHIKKTSKAESEASAASTEDESGTQLTGAAKSLCIPFEQKELKEGTQCFCNCGKTAKSWTLFGRSY